MANASCSTCTLVSNVLTLAGSISGTVAVGMTITGAGVPAGVTISSFGTGSGGVGTYNCSSSAANVTVAEAMVFSLSWIMPTVGNASAPQTLDLARAAGFGLIFASAFNGGSSAPGQEYLHGAHARAIHAQQTLSTQVFKSAASTKQGVSVVPTILTQPQYPEPRAPFVIQAAVLEPVGNLGAQYTFGTHAKAIYDSQIQAQIFRPIVTESNGFLAAEYSFGTHQKAIADSQIQAQVFKSAITQVTAASIAPLKTIIANPQELSRDLTIQGWTKIVPVAQGFLVTMVTAGPQFIDLTLQSNITTARPFQSLAPALPISPKFFFAQPQADTTQVPPNISRPPGRIAPIAPIRQISAAPTPWDSSVVQGQIFPTALPGPAKYIQPALILVFEQQYDKNVYPQVFNAPYIFEPPPPFTGFYVQAVSAGFYDGRFRTPGDIFLLLNGADFSDSTVDYQPPSSNTVGYGWMARTTSQQVFDWLQSNGSPYLPPTDPNRRFIY